MDSKAKAPRIQAFIEKTQGRSVIVMPRSDWDSLQVESTNLVKINIQKTPLSRVAKESCVIAAVAKKYGPSNARVSIYRYDEKDSMPINVDYYSVWLDLIEHPRIHDMVQAASTSIDKNLYQFSKENVFLVLEQPGNDHWSETLPSSVLEICISST